MMKRLLIFLFLAIGGVGLWSVPGRALSLVAPTEILRNFQWVVVDETQGSLLSEIPLEDLRTVLSRGVRPIALSLMENEASQLNVHEQILQVQKELNHQLAESYKEMAPYLGGQELKLSIVLMSAGEELVQRGLARVVDMTDWFSIQYVQAPSPQVLEVLEGRMQSLSVDHQAVAAGESGGLDQLVNGFKALVLKLKLSEGEQSFRLQILVDLPSQAIEMEQSTEEVDIRRVEIPGVDGQGIQPVVLLQLDSTLDSIDRPTLNIQFGQRQDLRRLKGEFALRIHQRELPDYTDPSYGNYWGYWATVPAEELDGRPDHDDLGWCERRHYLTPRLVGDLGRGAVDIWGVRDVVEGLPVAFHIYEINLGLAQMEVESLDLRLSLGVYLGSRPYRLGCLDIESVREKFRQEFTQTLQAQLAHVLRREGVIDQLIDDILQESLIGAQKVLRHPYRQ